MISNRTRFTIGTPGEPAQNWLAALRERKTKATDAGDDAAATAAFTAAGLDWTTMTTDLAGTLDATPVDAGHHHPAP